MSFADNVVHSTVGNTNINFHIDVFARILKLPCAGVDIFEHNIQTFDQYPGNESYLSASTLLHDNNNHTFIQNEEVKHFTLVSQIM